MQADHLSLCYRRNSVLEQNWIDALRQNRIEKDLSQSLMGPRLEVVVRTTTPCPLVLFISLFLVTTVGG